MKSKNCAKRKRFIPNLLIMTSTQRDATSSKESESVTTSPEYVKDLEKKVRQLEDTEKAILNVLEDARLLEEQLRRQTEERDSILRFLRSIGDGIVAVDLGGNMLFVNEVAFQIIKSSKFDTGKFDVSGIRCQDLFSLRNEKHPDVSIDFLERIVKGERCIEDMHGVLARPNGSTISIAFSVNPILGEDDKLLGCMISLKDMTEERQVESAKDRFLSVAAHQLRTPLSGMRWHMEMILGGDIGEVSPEVKETIGKIHENTVRMVGLINDLLNVALLDAGQSPESLESIGVSDVLSEIFEELKPLAEKSRVSLNLSLAGKSDTWRIRSFPRRLHEVFENLIHNAVKYSRPDSKVSVSLDAGEKGHGIISVQDEGIGIPKTERDKIFGKFFRASNALRWKTEGSGLGLAVVKSFVEEMGGTVSFESEEGKGTTFIVDLPLAK